VKVVSFDNFMSSTLGGWPVKADMSIYAGKPFECACGVTHSFSGRSSEVMRELGGMRFVLRCPERKAITLVRVKGIFSVVLESQYGTLLDVEESGQNEQRNVELRRDASASKV
jgi:hypothetical protein